MLIRVVLTGALANESMVLNGFPFTDGVMVFEGSEAEVGGVATYFINSYSAKVEYDNGNVAEAMIEVPEIGDPNTRQLKIIEAVNGIDKSEWVDDAIPHPKVKDVSTLMEDATVKKDEIIEVIEKWLS